MDTLLSLEPNVTRAEAIEKFRGSGIVHLLRRAQTGPLRSVADVYVPFHLYRVEVSNGSRRQVRWFGVDAVNGSLDPYEFEHAPDPARMLRVETRNRPDAALSEEQTRQLLEDKLRRVIFQTGFFRIRNLRLRSELVPLDFHIPYWIGFYGAGRFVRLRVLDAVRRCFEGAKARMFFQSWLAG